MTEKTKALYMSDLDYFSSLLEKDPTNALHLPVATLYNRLERHSEAAAIARQGLELNNDYPQLQVLLAEALLYDDKDDEALELLYDVIVADEDNYKALKLLGATFKATGNKEQALSYIQAAYLKAPEDSQLLAWIEELGGTELRYTEPEPEPESPAEVEEDFPENRVQANLDKADNALAYFKDFDFDAQPEKHPEDGSIDDDDLLAALNMGDDSSGTKIDINAPLNFPPIQPVEQNAAFSELFEPKAPEIPVELAKAEPEIVKTPEIIPEPEIIIEPEIVAEPEAVIEPEVEVEELPEPSKDEFILSHPLPKASELITDDDDEADEDLSEIEEPEDLNEPEDAEFVLSHPLPKASELMTEDDDEEFEDFFSHFLTEPEPDSDSEPDELETETDLEEESEAELELEAEIEPELEPELEPEPILMQEIIPTPIVRSSLANPPSPARWEDAEASPYDNIDRFVIGQTNIDGRALDEEIAEEAPENLLKPEVISETMADEEIQDVQTEDLYSLNDLVLSPSGMQEDIAEEPSGVGALSERLGDWESPTEPEQTYIEELELEPEADIVEEFEPTPEPEPQPQARPKLKLELELEPDREVQTQYIPVFTAAEIEEAKRQVASAEPVEAYPNNNVLLGSYEVSDDSDVRFERLFDTSMIAEKELNIDKSKQGFTYSVDELMDDIKKEAEDDDDDEDEDQGNLKKDDFVLSHPLPKPRVMPEAEEPDIPEDSELQDLWDAALEEDAPMPPPDLSRGLANISSLVEALTPLTSDPQLVGSVMSLQDNLSLFHDLDAEEFAPEKVEPDVDDEMVNALRAGLDNSASTGKEQLRHIRDLLDSAVSTLAPKGK